MVVTIICKWLSFNSTFQLTINTAIQEHVVIDRAAQGDVWHGFTRDKGEENTKADS
jgi:hypothetical protein